MDSNGGTGERDSQIRSGAQLRMLQALAARLNRLVDVSEIGESITTELAELIDYHDCRVYILEADGDTLMPVASSENLFGDPEETVEALLTKVGEGLTGHAAETRTSYYSPNVLNDPFAVTIPGTPIVDESSFVHLKFEFTTSQSPPTGSRTSTVTGPSLWFRSAIWRGRRSSWKSAGALTPS